MSKPSRSEIAEQLAKRLGGRYLPNEAPLQVGMEKIWDALISASVELEELRARGDKRFHEGQSYLLHELLTNPKLIVDDNFRKALIENGWAPSGELRARQNGCGVEVATDAKTGKPDYCPLPKGHEGSHVLDLTDAEVREPDRTKTRLVDFDNADHPFRKWWEEHGQYMMAGGGRKESIWAARGWIAREQLILGKEVTGESLDEIAANEKECQRLREALRRIANPIASMQADAEKQGLKLNGTMAVQLADDPNYLKGIASEALGASPELS